MTTTLILILKEHQGRGKIITQERSLPNIFSANMPGMATRFLTCTKRTLRTHLTNLVKFNIFVPAEVGIQPANAFVAALS